LTAVPAGQPCTTSRAELPQRHSQSPTEAPMPRPMHFEIPADNPERAVGFYAELFGWQFKKWDGPMPYWLVTTGPDSEPGINGGLMKRMGPPPADGQAVNAYVCTVGVTDLDARVSKAVGLGGTV